MKAVLCAIIALGFVLGACNDNSAPTGPTGKGFNKTEQAFDDYVDVNLYNSCCGTYITMSGSIHRTWSFRTDAAGNTTYKYHGNYQGFGGTDQNGRKYRSVGALNSSDTYEALGGGTIRVTHREAIVATGAGDDCTFVLKEIIEYSYDADGNLTITKDVYEIECI